MNTWHVTKNTLRHIKINEINNQFGTEFSGSLHCLIQPKGKVWSLKLLKKDESAQQVFPKLNEWNAITEKNIRVVEGFVCTMYRKKRFQSID